MATLAENYTATAEKLIGPEEFRTHQTLPVSQLSEEDAKAALIVACWELALHRMALHMACMDVSAGFVRRGGGAVLPAKMQPEAVTLTTETQ